MNARIRTLALVLAAQLLSLAWGTMLVAAGPRRAEVPLITAAPINGPDAGWRLTRGF